MMRKYLSRLGMRRFVAADAMAHDIYIVEFPKSGITWLCTLLANAALSCAGGPQRATYYSVQQYIPDIHMAEGLPLGNSILDGIPQRLIKSHCGHNPYYQNVIYLVRHPLSVMKSYHSYLNQQADMHFTPQQLVTHRKFGIPAWKKHVSGWLENPSQDKRLHLIRYEDLLQDTAGSIGLLAGNIGWNFPAAAIEEAVSLSTVAHMKETEELYRAHNPNYQLEFVRKKAPAFDAETTAEISRLCRHELDLLGYRDE